MPEGGRPSRASLDLVGSAVVIAAGAVFSAAVGAPLLVMITRVAAGLWARPPSTPIPGLSAGILTLFASSVGWSLLIAALACLFGVAAAWTMWRRGPVIRAAMVWPLLVPPTLAYAGWGLLRAPNTWLGAWMERAAAHGWNGLPVGVGRGLAVLGLALWAFPLAALAVWNGLRRVDSGVLEAMRVDGAMGAQVVLQAARMCVPDIARAAGLIGLIMLGSAVPLHLAQVETLAIQAWFALDNLPTDQRWRAWMSAAPLVGVAVLSGWILGGRAARFDPGEVAGAEPGARWRDLVPGSVPWVLGVAVPMALFLANLGRHAALVRFWTDNSRAIGRSATTALGVAGATLVLSLAAGWLGGRWKGTPRGIAWALRLALITGLLPGVLVGSVFAGIVTTLGSQWLDDSLIPVMTAHVARFGFLGLLAGAWGATTARRRTGDLARLDGAQGWRGWWAASGRPALGLHAAAAVAAGVFSLHEIESTVQVMPPGDCLARVVLGDLHYLRTDDMSAAGVWLIGAGVVPALVAAAVRSARGRART